MKLTKARLKQIIKEEIEGQAAPAPRGTEVYVVELYSHDGQSRAIFTTEESAKELVARLEKQKKSLLKIIVELFDRANLSTMTKKQDNNSCSRLLPLLHVYLFIQCAFISKTRGLTK